MALSKIDVANMLTGATPVANGGTAATTLAAAGLGKRPNAKPIFYNGNMAISQRATSATGKTGDGYHAVDRMNMLVTNCGTYTVAQEALTSGNAFANGFANAFRIDTTTADASPASGDILAVQQIFEGQNVQMFKKGTANAEKFTLAFWVKSNKTGNGQVNLFDNDTSGNRIVGATYSISSADTWEHKVVNFPADTTGPLDDDNAKSFIVEWWLDSGTDYSSGAVPSAWEAKSNTDRNAGGALQIARNTDNDWAITGVQLEVGEYSSTTLPPFQHESYGDNLRRCMRYFYKLGGTTDTYKRLSVNFCNPSNRNQTLGLHHLPVPMRTAQTVTIPSASDFAVGHLGGSNACSSVTINNDGALPNNALLSCLAITGSNASTDCVMLEMTYASTNTMEVSAEL
jgi:hypothetical protein|tara:strand:+ start:1047 stop:2246 length:1200 start_codon:yes stop_codon:yes gene_type:complete